MSTIVKTGVVLKKINVSNAYDWPGFKDGKPIDTIYGDLHVVGGCCILYYPPTQVEWGVSHGWIDLADPYNEFFDRKTVPDHILVLPASHVKLRRGALHPHDMAKFIAAEGLVDETRGEQG